MDDKLLKLCGYAQTPRAELYPARGYMEKIPEPENIPQVVGIGTSARGWEILQRLLENLPADTGFAFVAIQHNDENLTDENGLRLVPDVLEKATTMPVSPAAAGAPLEANHVYLPTANLVLSKAGSSPKLTEPAHGAGTRWPIDCFLLSLAEHCGPGAIGIVLPGTGADGAAGIEAIRAAGGVAWGSGSANSLLSPESIAEEIVSLARRSGHRRDPPARVPSVSGEKKQAEGDVLAVLHGITGIDFSFCRAQTMRLIVRRIAAHKLNGFEEYCARLRNDPAEAAALERELRIGATGFFRDPASFERLKKLVFPRLLERRSADYTLRMWVAGCATGEEAFSIAITLREYLNEISVAFPAQIFASDISLEAIEKARLGRYPGYIAADLTAERLERNFTKIEGGYQIDKHLREMCIFSTHNLIADPPFSKLDLISCRDVLIYVGNLRDNIVPLFHRALKPGGFLMLGASEEALPGDLFSAADGEHRIYSKLESQPETGSKLDMRKKTASFAIAPPGSVMASPAAQWWGVPDLRNEADRLRGNIRIEATIPARSKKRPAPDEPVVQASGFEAPDNPRAGDFRDRQIAQLKLDLAAAEERFHSAIEAGNTAVAQARDFAASTIEIVRQPLLVLDTDLRIRTANAAFYKTFHLSPRETEGQFIHLLSGGSWDLPDLRTSLDELLRNGGSFADLEIEQNFPAVGRRNLVIGGCQVDRVGMLLVAVDDVSEHRVARQALTESEEHLRQSQKMEAVGRLVGGICHDFNNLLTVIVGYCSMLSDRLSADPSAMEQVLGIKSAGERAASLTQQLLAFSRRRVLQPKVLDLNAVVADIDSMLHRLMGERIEIAVDCDAALWRVRADPGEIGRAVMNLSLNARDAMPSGGTLTLKTANVALTEEDAAGAQLAPGNYVMMAVDDTGGGIDPEVRAHMFEPFFTTKGPGKGTGLGLATVLGIVEQSGGMIHCESQPGQGTSFRIFLPAVAEPVQVVAPAPASLEGAPRGYEVILLVEDERMVRVLARKVLEASGYVIHEARNGPEGLKLCETHEGPIDLLMTDVVMPGLGGRALVEAALKLRPTMKVLYMSGHMEDVVLREGIQKGTAFLQKPFTPAGLARKVRETLDAGARTAAGKA
jgi:chemotaxis methyl-accepting protein methylase/signal transduction histidine kinase/chemotaxis response regulator CheB